MSQTITNQQELLLERISPIIDKVLKQDSWYEKLTKQQIIADITRVLEQVNISQILEADEADLTKRIKRIMAISITAGMLQDLTPEEMKIFDEAVEGR